MMTAKTGSQDILLRRQGLVFIAAGQDRLGKRMLEAVDLELAALGYVLSARLRARLGTLSVEAAAQLKTWLCAVLAAKFGADQKHVPLFRKFPRDVPKDTHALWVRRVLAHYLQAPEQQCLFCLRTGTTHVLKPCEHVVCEHCFDGANYSACPICNRQVDQDSPFFQPAPERPLPKEPVRFKVLDLGEDLAASARELFLSFCHRTQAMNPDDRADLATLAGEHAEHMLDWIPPAIPVKENAAILFGTLCQSCAPDAVLELARPYLQTATDVLRLLAAYSGADPALQGETIVQHIVVQEQERWWGPILKLLHRPVAQQRHWPAQTAIKVRRFKLGRLRRPFRRALLAILEGFNADLLTEDMLRHRSYWVWIGQFLHPHEYAARYPRVAAAFQVIRRKSPSGQRPPPFKTFYGKVEAAMAGDALGTALELLRRRPGELGRRLDHLLRLAGTDARAQHEVLEVLGDLAPKLTIPMLLTLRSHFSTRHAVAPIRIYWPKGGTAGGISAPDTRPPLPPALIRRVTATLEDTLLQRLGTLPKVSTWLIDQALKEIIVPFNERTASPGAIALPRGSTLDAPVPKDAPRAKFVRLFLHWCQPQDSAYDTDLDLSVGFYDADWGYKGVCSYYELQCEIQNKVLAKSAGDLTSAPHPDGASEFVDIDYAAALDAGVRYAVMVVNAYAGLTFSQLERAFAGYMIRGDRDGQHFDPRTVEMKFNLQGEHGVYIPLVFDFQAGKLHWLDVYSKGMPALNNVASSSKAIQRICPHMIAYFASGARMSMYELALLHAAARGTSVYVRHGVLRQLQREPHESAAAFLARLRGQAGAEADPEPLAEQPDLNAFVLHGDLALAPESTRYVVFPERINGNSSAADFLVAGKPA